jgi:GntR family transcriptional regulator, transcriptional repressor for pyruvate dehydrogenase complex
MSDTDPFADAREVTTGEGRESPPRNRARQPVKKPVKSSILLAETILQDIAKEGLRPGDPLPAEKAMIDRYGFGRGTVREALRLLEYQGAVQIKQGINGGPSVQEPDSAHFASTILFLLQLQRTPFESIVEVRAAIEPMICRLAAARIDAASLKELEETILEMRRRADDPEDTVFFDLNTRFHNVIAWSSGNTLFRYLADSLLDIMDGAVVGLRYAPRTRKGVIHAHQAIFDALAARDEAAAEQRMRQHLAAWEEYATHEFPSALKQVVPWSWNGAR